MYNREDMELQPDKSAASVTAGEFFVRVTELYDSLSKTNRRIADYVASRFDEVIFSSVASIAAELGTSEATIVRFAQTLGYSGFPDLKRELVTHYREQISPAKKLKNYLDTLSPGDRFYGEIVEQEIEYLKNSVKTVQGEAFHEAVTLICEAGHRYVYATGANTGLAQYMSFRLNRFRLHTSASSDTGKNIFENFPLFNKNDVVITYSFHQPTREHKVLMDFTSKNGVKTILITDTFVPPMVQNADLVLYARRGPFGLFHSLIVPMAISNALIMAVASRLGKDSIESLQDLSDIRRMYAYEGVGSLNDIAREELSVDEQPNGHPS
jgi:DNA-binding MurR/RpiR family transcriptional regulator